MDIEYLNPDGVHQAEKKALIKISDALPNDWRGYASLEMHDRQQGSSEIDLILVTQFHIVIVELKQIHGELTSDGRYWYKNGSRLYKSPVGVTELKAKKLKQKIENKLASKINKIPYVKSCVVIYGNVNRNNLTDDEKEYVCELDAFLKVGKPSQYSNILGLLDWEKKFSRNQCPNNSLKIWNQFFSNNSNDFTGRALTIQGYTVDGEAMFSHPYKIYQEYFSQKAHDSNYQALMRCWNFNAPQILNLAQTPSERRLIGLRESKVLGYIDIQDESLKNAHFSLLYVPEPQEITADFVELYEWPRNRLRLDEFINKNSSKLKNNQRLDLIQTLTSQIARLHNIDVAHRDVGAHSVWLALPSKVVLSNFLTASYPDPQQETVRSSRDVLRTCRISIPEDILEDPDGTSRTRDVYLTGACAHYIAYGIWPPKIDDVYSWKVRDNDPFEGRLNSWFEKMLHLEAAERYQDMAAALDALNDACGNIDKPTGLADITNELFLSDCNIWQEYEPQVLSTKGTKMLLQSVEHNVGIKLWNGVNQLNPDESKNYQLTLFLQKIKSLKNANIPCNVTIKDFGYNAPMQCVYVVYDWIEGTTWSEWLASSQSIEDVICTLDKLLIAFIQLHQNQFNHGDFHPGNIILTKGHDEKLSPIFIDLFDYNVDENPPYNPTYVPDNYQNLPPEALDRYGVVKIIHETSDVFSLDRLSEYCDNLLQQPEISEGDITRFADNLKNIVKPAEIDDQLSLSINPQFPRQFKLDEFHADEGVYYLAVKSTKNNNGSLLLKVYISSFSHQLDLHINPETRLLERCYLSPIAYSQYIRNHKSADIELVGKITEYKEGITSDLVEWLLAHPVIAEHISRKAPNLEEMYRDNFDISEFSEMSTRLLWKTFIGTEEEVLPRVVATQRSQVIQGSDILVYYSANNHPLDLDLSRERYLIKRDADQDFKIIGSLVENSHGALRIKPFWPQTIEAGEGIRIEGNLTASSLKKRTEATETIVKGRAIIPNLPDFFDLKKQVEPTIFPGEITDDELDQYDETDGNGDIIFSLNEKQRESFRQLYSHGPVGLLQGPPGTGKTAFISSFVHYILSKGSSRVLLVSQSHEAVNNAAEKVRNLFRRQDVDLGVVRLGNESNLSEPLLDIHEKAIQEHFRDKFRAEYKKRVSAALSHLGLPVEFIKDCLEFEVSFGERISKILRVHSSLPADKREEGVTTQHKILKTKTLEYFTRMFAVEKDFDQVEIIDLCDLFYEQLCLQHNINSPQNVKKARQIIGLSGEWLDVLSSSRANFQNFLVRTKTLVCGTCVGIGRVHYGINENIYDWVIIDEAARSSASELAIAMQVGRRILLVGDHMQLPPMYEEEHLKAVQRRLPDTTEAEISVSDFERSFLSPYGKEVGQTLPYQYRMAPPIGGMVSACFYNNQLETKREEPVSWVQNLPEAIGTTVTWIDTTMVGSKAYEEASIGGRNSIPSKSNNYEISIVLQLVGEIIEADYFAGTFADSHEPPIGIICMYSKQRSQMLKKFNQADWSRRLLERRLVKIDTVDGYQGKENSIVIVSLVRSNKQQTIGFLSEKYPAATKRTNVAISRAKERLYLVGSTRMFVEDNKNSALGKVCSYIKSRCDEDEHFSILNSKELFGE